MYFLINFSNIDFKGHHCSDLSCRITSQTKGRDPRCMADVSTLALVQTPFQDYISRWSGFIFTKNLSSIKPYPYPWDGCVSSLRFGVVPFYLIQFLCYTTAVLSFIPFVRDICLIHPYNHTYNDEIPGPGLAKILG